MNDTLSFYAVQRARWIKFGHSFERMITEDLGEFKPDMDLKSKIDLYHRVV